MNILFDYIALGEGMSKSNVNENRLTIICVCVCLLFYSERELKRVYLRDTAFVYLNLYFVHF